MIALNPKNKVSSSFDHVVVSHLIIAKHFHILKIFPDITTTLAHYDIDEIGYYN